MSCGATFHPLVRVLRKHGGRVKACDVMAAAGTEWIGRYEQMSEGSRHRGTQVTTQAGDVLMSCWLQLREVNV